MADLPDAASHRPQPHLLQINTWVWLETLSRAAGRVLLLADVPDDVWDDIAGAGFDLVYLMGVWTRSIAGRHLFRTSADAFAVFDHALPGWTIDNVVGSPFSIARYEPDPRIGDWAAIDLVRARLAARGMRLILDFVPNHVGPDHPWVASSPERLMQGSAADFRAAPGDFILSDPPGASPCFIARGRDPYFAPWADTAQIDHADPATRAELIALLREIGQHCDGLRCDMAMLVLNEVFAGTWGRLLRGRAMPQTEFWADAVAALPADFIWLAEAYWGTEMQLQGLGFTYTYDKQLYDSLIDAAAEWTRGLLRAPVDGQQRMARFIENHDEPRAFGRVGRDRLPGLTALVATLPGLRFFHAGQGDGLTIHVPMPLDRAAAETVDEALRQSCDRILRMADAPVFHDGAWSLLTLAPTRPGSADGLVAYSWRLGEDLRIIVVNLWADAGEGWLRLPELGFSAACDFEDMQDGTVYRRQGDRLSQEGLFVWLGRYGMHLFRVLAA